MDSDETSEPEGSSEPSEVPSDEDIMFALGSLGGVASLAVRKVEGDLTLPGPQRRAVLAGVLMSATDEICGSLPGEDGGASLFYGQGLFWAIKLGVAFGPDGMHEIIMAGLDNLCRRQERIADEIRFLVESADGPGGGDGGDDTIDDFQLMLDNGPVHAALGAAAFFAATVAGMRLIDSITLNPDAQQLERSAWSAEIDARLAFARDSLIKAASATLYEREVWDGIRGSREI